MNKKTLRPTFWQLYADHVRPRASLFLGDATLMALAIVAPAIVLVGSKVMEALGAGPAFVHAGETVDGVWLLLAIGVTCVDSAGKLLVLAISGWREALRNKP